MMKRYTLITSILLIVIGIITAWIGNNLSTVTESGLLQDSILMPIGAVLSLLGLLALAVGLLWHMVDFFRNRRLKRD